jgi:hypothetical protein
MKQLENIEQKDIIKKVTGKVLKLWEPKTFKGPKGEFTIQGGVIEIDGDEYGLKFFDRTEDVEKLEKQVVTLVSTRSKHGLYGVSLEHESYSKKDGTKVDRDLIKVTKSGNIIIGDDNQEQLPAAKSTTNTTFTQIVQQIKDPVEAIENIIHLHLMTNDLVRAAYAKKGYDEETLRSYVSSIFIEANRKGIALVPKKEEASQELDPEDWASAIVPSGSNKGKKLGEIGKPALTKLYEHYLAKGFDTPFAKCVEQAGNDLQLGGDPEEQANEHGEYEF